jgi:hypothetical protein
MASPDNNGDARSRPDTFNLLGFTHYWAMSRDADHGSLITIINEVVRMSGGSGERLFFYFAGHGLTAKKDFQDDDALLTSDFTTAITTNSLSLRSITDHLSAFQFLDQFFFVDACRNAPFTGNFRVGEMPWAQGKDPNRPGVQQFVFQATSPGLPSIELSRAGDEGGAFTDALLKGLDGTGPAKVWQPARRNYVVTVDSLLDYVIAEVEEKLQPRSSKDREFLLVPHLRDERGATRRKTNPVLVEVDPASVAKELLTIFLVRPSPSPDKTTVSVERDERVVDARPYPGSPMQFLLPPREYAISTTAPGFRPESPSWEVDLYAPLQLEIALARDTTSAPPSPPSMPPPGSRGPGKLVVSTSDQFSLLEVTDTAGNVKAKALRTVTAELEPGFYRVRLVSADGLVVNQNVPNMLSGETRSIDIEPAPIAEHGLFETLRKERILDAPLQNTIHISETVGPIGWADTSTLLSVGGASRVLDWKGEVVPKLGQLGIRAFSDTFPSASGVGVLVGADFDTLGQTEDYIRQVRIKIKRQDDVEQTSMENFASGGPAGQFMTELPPDNYWLRVELPDSHHITSFALTVLPRRVTLLVFQRRLDGRTTTLQYFSSEGQPIPRTIRQAEVLQRTYASGRFDRVAELAENFQFDKSDDPILAILGAHAFIRTGRAEEIRERVSGFSERFHDLADALIIRGAWLSEKRKDEE